MAVNPYLSYYIEKLQPSVVDIIIQMPTAEASSILSNIQDILKPFGITLSTPLTTGQLTFVRAVVPTFLLDKLAQISGIKISLNEYKKISMHYNLSIFDSLEGEPSPSTLPEITIDQFLPLPINPFKFNPQLLLSSKELRYLPSTYRSPLGGEVTYRFIPEIYVKMVDVKDYQSKLDGSGVKVAVLDTGYAPQPQGTNRAGGIVKVLSTSLADPIPIDGNGHSSWCINTAVGGRWDYFPFGPGMGFAPKADAYSIKVLSSFGNGTTYDVISGMKVAALDIGADVISMSLGGPIQGSVEDDPAVQALEDLVSNSKAIFVVASGDSGQYGQYETMDSPAVAPHAISVASISLIDEQNNTSPETYNVAYWSSAGGDKYPWSPTCAAYGGGRAMPQLQPDELIYNGLAPWSILDGIYSGIRGLGQEGIHGTSQSTPEVAGLIALLLQAKLIEGDTGKERTENFIKTLSSKYKHNYFSGYGVPKLSDFL